MRAGDEKGENILQARISCYNYIATAFIMNTSKLIYNNNYTSEISKLSF